MTETTCPLDYRYGAAALNRAPDCTADTLYVVGGLYGNPEALQEVLAMQAREERAGRAVMLVFNGDFHWFNAHPTAFRAVSEQVLAHRALRGNVEAELARDGGALDCGCNYPPHVDAGIVARSNEIFARLKGTAMAFPAVRSALGGLPMHLVVQVGGQRVGVLHGDPDSLAGWGLAEESLAALEGWPVAAADGAADGDDAPDCGASAGGVPPAQTSAARIADWFRHAAVDAFAVTHTCLPYCRDVEVDGRRRVLINNGAAGMPNFSGDRRGLLTRISVHPAEPAESLYGLCSGGVRYDALPIAYDHERWLARFRATWAEGSPAHTSYHDRIVNGPRYPVERAVRGATQRNRPRRTA